jgi:hypothetical protein
MCEYTRQCGEQVWSGYSLQRGKKDKKKGTAFFLNKGRSRKQNGCVNSEKATKAVDGLFSLPFNRGTLGH